MKRIKISKILIYLIVLVLGLSCLLPLWNVVAISFSDSASATANRVSFIPINFNLNAYKKIMEDTQFWRSFRISVFRVFFGLAINMILTILMAYPLSKTKREFRAQGIYMKLTVFAMVFPAGMIPLYMVVKNMGLLDSIWSMIIPTAVPVYNVILLMNFFRGVPKSLEEAAEIDGASPFKILVRVMIPMSKPCLATLSLFSIVGHWNDYFTAILYINRTINYPLQTYIRQVSASFDMSKVNNVELLKQYLQVSSRNLNSAKIVVSVIPLLIIYPIFQRYFVTGIVMGAVKE